MISKFKLIKSNLIGLAVLSATLSGCSFVEDDLRMFARCGIAANQLDKPDASYKISKKLEEYIKENDVQGSAGDAMFLTEDVKNEELKLYEKTTEGQIYTLVKVYNSSECQDIHEQDEISMPWKYYLLYIFI
ncbi:MAG: hypothetical protein WAT29_10505 [Thiolinea sp.]